MDLNTVTPHDHEHDFFLLLSTLNRQKKYYVIQEPRQTRFLESDCRCRQDKTERLLIETDFLSLPYIKVLSHHLSSKLNQLFYRLFYESFLSQRSLLRLSETRSVTTKNVSAASLFTSSSVFQANTLSYPALFKVIHTCLRTSPVDFHLQEKIPDWLTLTETTCLGDESLRLNVSSILGRRCRTSFHCVQLQISEQLTIKIVRRLAEAISELDTHRGSISLQLVIKNRLKLPYNLGDKRQSLVSEKQSLRFS